MSHNELLGRKLIPQIFSNSRHCIRLNLHWGKPLDKGGRSMPSLIAFSYFFWKQFLKITHPFVFKRHFLRFKLTFETCVEVKISGIFWSPNKRAGTLINFLKIYRSWHSYLDSRLLIFVLLLGTSITWLSTIRSLP